MKNLNLLFSLLFVFLLVASCKTDKSEDRAYLSIRGFTQGTNYMVKYSSPDTINYKDEIEYLLAEIDTSMSTYNEHSIISKVNNNEEVEMDKYFKEVFNTAMKISKETQGAFDITVGPLVNAWGFGQEEVHDIDSAVVDSIMQFVGYEKVSLKEGSVH